MFDENGNQIPNGTTGPEQPENSFEQAKVETDSELHKANEQGQPEIENSAGEYRYDRSYYQAQEQTYSSSNQQYDNMNQANAEYRQPEESKKETRKSHKGMKKIIGKAVTLVLCSIAVGIIGGGSFYMTNRVLSGDSSSKKVSIATTGLEKNSDNNIKNVSSSTTVVTDVSQVVANVMPSVVSISNVGTEKYTDFFGQTGTYQSESSGSGIIIGQNDSELLIVTNQHVVLGADTLDVGFVDKTSCTANVKGSDSEHDIAVIAVPIGDLSPDTLNKIKVATRGDSENLKVGEPAIAIGNALGYGQSVTVGVISALDREVKIENITNKLIQTDAAINPGNSGGALLNMSGEVIGINSVKFASTEVEGMGYSIPISDVSSIIDDLMNKQTKKKVSEEERAYLGISCVDVNSSVAQNYNMPEGVYVAQVEKNSAAEKAGIKKGDIITKLGDATVSSYTALTQELQYYAAGSTVKVVVQSPVEKGYGYEEKTYDVNLDKKEK